MDFDLNTLRIGVTLASLLLFVALVAHSWSRRRLPEHDAAAMLPFIGEPAASDNLGAAAAPAANSSGDPA
jgi:cytochrome c oxidase cbb3-type subunit 4